MTADEIIAILDSPMDAYQVAAQFKKKGFEVEYHQVVGALTRLSNRGRVERFLNGQHYKYKRVKG